MESYKASIEDDVVTEDCVCNEESCVDDEEEQCGGDDNDSEYVADEEEEDDEDDDDDNDDDVSEVEKLSERVWSLETAVTDIKDMVQHLFNNLVSSNQKKVKPLRQQTRELHPGI